MAASAFPARRTSAPRRPRPAASPSLAGKFQKFPFSPKLSSPPRLLPALHSSPASPGPAPPARPQLPGACRSPFPGSRERGRRSQRPSHSLPPGTLLANLGQVERGFRGHSRGQVGLGLPSPARPPSPPPPPSPCRTWGKHGPPGGRGLTAPEVSNRKGKEGGNFLPSPHAGCQVQPPPLGLLLAAAPGPAPRPPLAPPSRPFFPSPSRLPPAAALAASASPRPPARARPRRGPSALR